MPEYLTIDHLKLKDLIRIFSKIKVDPVTGCWLWQGYCDPYGVTTHKGRNEKVHRLLWAWTVGPLERGHGHGKLQLDHFVCDNPPCCNPAHLNLGSQKTNILRGQSPAAVNAKKLICANGHDTPLEQTPGDSGRRCVQCRREYDRAYALIYNKTEKRRQYMRNWYQKRKAH